MVYQDVMRSTDLEPESKTIYAYLASFCGNMGTCHPSRKLMLKELKMSEQRFSKYMNALIALGVVKVSRERTGNIFGKNIYTITHEIVITEVENKESRRSENRSFDNRSSDQRSFEKSSTNSNSLNNNSLNNNSLNSNTSCPELKTPDKQAVIFLMLNDKTEYPVYQEDISGWIELYPAVDVMQELRKMKGWLDANPKRRKTKSGIKRFINSWLAKEQDRGGSRSNNSGSHTITEEERAKLEAERIADDEEWLKRYKPSPNRQDIF